MQSRISIYLAGSVVKDKNTETNKIFWDAAAMKAIREAFHPTEVSFLNPSDRKDDLSNPRSVLGRDLMQVYFSDFVFVDAQESRGMGVGAEMLFAIQHNIPVITIAPRNSHYRKDKLEILGQEIINYEHPFAIGLSTQTFATLQEALLYLKKNAQSYMQQSSIPITCNKFLNVIHTYLNTQLNADTPMLDIFSADPRLQAKKNALMYTYRLNDLKTSYSPTSSKASMWPQTAINHDPLDLQEANGNNENLQKRFEGIGLKS